MASYRKEEDLLGARDLPIDVLHWHPHGSALENFPLAGRPVDPRTGEFIRLCQTCLRHDQPGARNLEERGQSRCH